MFVVPVRLSRFGFAFAVLVLSLCCLYFLCLLCPDSSCVLLFYCLSAFVLVVCTLIIPEFSLSYQFWINCQGSSHFYIWEMVLVKGLSSPCATCMKRTLHLLSWQREATSSFILVSAKYASECSLSFSSLLSLAPRDVSSQWSTHPLLLMLLLAI